ncbi:hypothetical protein KBY58_02845 [Cyanobium sp. HWJ4-Hawea]|uniref:helix-turn-helix transcriptional regulator n=1 Tax=Cyanobium sp. HWJ4-Hawea TaxID=2823713 RepID=UPI0020CC119D|nr:hypothetical protein [Cyanobium sp. HWJ4-Hawea]MCP9808369.1 hypothetical protein [Cyanobium sp. HWJ4-Hawea]
MKTAKATPHREFVPTGQAIVVLGVSSSTLCRWVKQGLFEEGVHFRNGLTTKSPRRWDLHAVEQRIAQLRQLPDPLRPQAPQQPPGG